MPNAPEFLHGEYWEKLKGDERPHMHHCSRNAQFVNGDSGAADARRHKRRGNRPHQRMQERHPLPRGGSKSVLPAADTPTDDIPSYSPRPAADHATTRKVAVVANGSGNTTDQHEGRPVASSICQQSHNICEISVTDGENKLHVPPRKPLKAWLNLAGPPATPTPFVNGVDRVSNNAAVVEDSKFIHTLTTEAQTAIDIAKSIRRAYRRDLMHEHPAGNTEDLLFPPAILSRPGIHLREAVSSMPPRPQAAAAAIVRHLTFCEALLLPPPFPAEALAHFLSLTAGVLDLSPPRVPTHTPISLLTIITLLAPLLADGPPLQDLHIPVQFQSHVDPLAPLFPHFSTLTSLCITNGKVTYTELAAPEALSSHTVADMLRHLSPVALRHLSIDALVSVNTPPVHHLLCSFTALTSLRLSSSPLALRHMPSLASLFLTHLPANSHQELPPEACEALTSLRRIHMSGSAVPVHRMYQRTSGHSQVDRPVPAGTRTIPPITTFMGRMDPDTENDVYGSIDSSGEDVLCCGFPFPGCGASLLRERVTKASVASSYVHFFRYRFVSGAWGPAVDELPRQQKKLLCGYGPAGLTALNLATRALSAETLALTRRIVAGEVPHELRVLCVLRLSDVPPRSAFRVCQVQPHSGIGVSGQRQHRHVRGTQYDCGRGWVTARPSGVAHPLCALEMLHYNSAPHSMAEPGSGSNGSRHRRVVERVSEGVGLCTLRLSEDAFIHIQDLVQENAACMSSLRDLSVHCAHTSQRTPHPRLDLACISRLTTLRTISLQGVPAACSAPERLSLPPALTALLLHGHDCVGKPAAATAFGPPLLQLSELQCLDVDIMVTRTERSPARPDAVQVMRRGLLEGLRPVLLDLPLHLGARLRFREAPAESVCEGECPKGT